MSPEIDTRIHAIDFERQIVEGARVVAVLSIPTLRRKRNAVCGVSFPINEGCVDVIDIAGHLLSGGFDAGQSKGGDTR